MTTMNATKTTYLLLVIAGACLGYLLPQLVDDTKAELAAQRLTDNIQNEKLVRLEEQMTYLRNDLSEIKQGQKLILQAVGK